MFDILTAVFHDDPLQYGTSCYLKEPQTTAERQVKRRLDALDAETAKKLETCIEALAQEQGEQALSFRRALWRADDGAASGAALINRPKCLPRPRFPAVPMPLSPHPSRIPGAAGHW